MSAPTVYPDLNEVLREFVENVEAILDENFCGAYLQGSFAVGDADEHSDVDFIVVTHDEITATQLDGLQTLHRRIYGLGSPWAQHLEGSYVPKHDLRRIDESRTPYWYLDNGATELIEDNHCNTAVVRWTLREQGVVLAGPDPMELIDPVSAAQLSTDARTAMREWNEWLKDHPLSRRAQGLLVLSICRMLQTAAVGRVTSKRDAGKWALGTLDAKWSSVVQAALDDRPDPWTKVRQPADPEALVRTLAFLDYAMNETIPDRAAVRIEPWGKDDQPILEKALGDPEMMKYLGGPETPEKIAERQARYERPDSRQYKIVDEATGEAVGWVGYWERTWRDEQVFEIGWSVLSAFQGRGIASRATAQAIAKAKLEKKHRFLHAFPSVENAPSNAICRKLGFTLIEEREFEYPPGSRSFMRCNDWRLDLSA